MFGNFLFMLISGFHFNCYYLFVNVKPFFFVFLSSTILLLHFDYQRNVGSESLDDIVTENVPKYQKSHPKFVVSGS